MQDKQCPKCNLYNPPNAQRCDCGYDFESGKMEQSYLVRGPREKHLRGPKDWRSQIKYFVGVLGAIIVMSIASVTVKHLFQSAVSDPIDIDRMKGKLEHAIAIANKSLPVSMGDGISFDGVRFMGKKTLVYEYSFTDLLASQIDGQAQKKQTYERTLTTLCNNAGQKDWLEKGITTTYVYRDRIGNEVFRVPFTNNDCNLR